MPQIVLVRCWKPDTDSAFLKTLENSESCGWNHSSWWWNTSLHLFSSQKFLVVIQCSIWMSCVIYTKDIIIAYLPQKKMQILRSLSALSWYFKNKNNCYIFLFRSCLFRYRRIIPIIVEQSFNKRTVGLWRFMKTAYWKYKMSELITKIFKIGS